MHDLPVGGVVCRLLSAAFVFLATAGCQRPNAANEATDISHRLSFSQNAPTVGSASLTVELTDNNGAPVRNATLMLEGNMNHAGMKPVFAAMKEGEPGKYSGALDFTMAGDWFVLIKGDLADGRTLRRKVNVPGVKSR